MYVLTVIGLLLVLPTATVVIDVMMGSAISVAALMLKWFVFWAVGVRLSLAGIRQITRPEYTARVILGLGSDDALIVIRELGFANCAIGCVGLGSLPAPGWRLPAALAGAIFYGLAAINHSFHAGRGRLQNVALWSDALMAILLGTSFVLAIAAS